MQYYLKTLEGVARFGEVSADRKTAVRNAFDYYYKYHGDVADPVERFYKTFMSLTMIYTDEEIKTLYDRADLKPEAREAAQAQAEAKAAQAEAEADAAAAQVAAEATQIINQGESMNEQNIEIGTQVISSGHEYTVIDETPTTIVYEDESGKMYVEEKPKTNIFMWLGLGLLLWKILK